MSPVAALAASEAEALEPPALTDVVEEDPQPAINTPAAIGISRNRVCLRRFLIMSAILGLAP
jgi:hypothetical protein